LEQAITFERGAVVQGNFDTFPLLKSADLPTIEAILLENGERPAGVGEEAVPTVAPALANALFAAGDEAVTRLPLAQTVWHWVR
jgi:isoquinoline 1-oxidoreductase beta subunit